MYLYIYIYINIYICICIGERGVASDDGVLAVARGRCICAYCVYVLPVICII